MSVVRRLLFLPCLLVLPAAAAELWVSPSGSDLNPGTRTHPLASVGQAQRNATELRRLSKSASDEPLNIILRAGIYPLTSPLQFYPEASGTDANPTTLMAAPGEKPVLSGGIPITGWNRLTRRIAGLLESAQGQVWVAEAPKLGGKVLDFRQLWVNGCKAIRARQPNANSLARLTGWDKSNHLASIPAITLAGITQPDRLEMIIDQVWEIAVLRVKSIQLQETNALVTFQQPESDLEFQHPWPPVTVNSNYAAPFFLANAIQFLDSPGEWFLDPAAGKLYYWPRAGEDMAQAEVIAPALEAIVNIDGLPDSPVSNLQFKGITFAHTTWLRPSEQGHVPLQAGMFMLDAHKLSPRGTSYAPKLDNVAWIGRPPAAVLVKSADHISFENCTFEHLAATGLDFESGTSSNQVQSCTFRDIGGNGLQLGEFSQTNVETHTPFNPSDYGVICSHTIIADNTFTGCGAEDWGCMGVCIGYARDIAIRNNEVSQMPYTGISVGWGWTKQLNASRDNLIFANHIHHVGQMLGDLGGIYTLSTQPGTVVAENYIHDITPSPFVPDPNHWFYLYLDEGSSYITVRDNWCPSEKFLKNANGPGNVWTNNGPQVSEQIKTNAGPKK